MPKNGSLFLRIFLKSGTNLNVSVGFYLQKTWKREENFSRFTDSRPGNTTAELPENYLENPVDGFFLNVSLIIAIVCGEDQGMAISILAVDDEQNLLELLMTVLGKRGFKVKTALNGIEALKLLDQESFELALLDLKMSPVNGVQLLKEIKDRRPLTKVIMMTAYPTNETRAEASVNGASAYLTKPVDIQKLVDTINALAH